VGNPPSKPVHPQLPLALAARSPARFEEFVAGENALAVDMLERFADGVGEQQLLLWGGPGCGKTHLLNAVCHRVGEVGAQAVNLPLAECLDYGPSLLDGLESLPVICIDDAHCSAGMADWEEGLFDLINRVRALGARLLFSCADNPAQLDFQLEDLRSRLMWGPVLRLLPAGEAEIAAVLTQRAHVLGLSLDEAVLRYLLTRHARDLPGALAQLDLLDQASLAAQRRLTVPFVKSVLEG
jgi:DnaA family protein